MLLDEFEKAHANVWDLFLQVFDDARLTDAAGEGADFRHCIIILTTNSSPGVVDVRADPHDPGLWLVTGPQSIRGHLAVHLAARGLGVRHLRRVGDELDEIYQRYFSRDEGDHGNAA